MSNDPKDAVVDLSKCSEKSNTCTRANTRTLR